MKHIDKAVQYVQENVDYKELESAVKQMAERREPLYSVNPKLCDSIYDLMEEYGADNNLPEGWWLNDMDEEDVLFRITRNDNVNN